MKKNNPNIKKKLTYVISGLLLAAVLAGCTGGVSQPGVTQAPAEPTSTPTSASPTAYPEPGGDTPYPSALPPYPPEDQTVVSPPYPDPQQPYPAPWQPQTADESLQRGEAFVEGMDILVAESFPPQYTLNLRGTLPTPCHQLRIEVAPPDSQNRIQVSVYSVVDPNAICTQVLAPFEASVPLQGQPTGKYTFVVNGKEAGSVDVP